MRQHWWGLYFHGTLFKSPNLVKECQNKSKSKEILQASQMLFALNGIMKTNFSREQIFERWHCLALFSQKTKVDLFFSLFVSIEFRINMQMMSSVFRLNVQSLISVLTGKITEVWKQYYNRILNNYIDCNVQSKLNA